MIGSGSFFGFGVFDNSKLDVLKIPSSFASAFFPLCSYAVTTDSQTDPELLDSVKFTFPIVKATFDFNSADFFISADDVKDSSKTCADPSSLMVSSVGTCEILLSSDGFRLESITSIEL